MAETPEELFERASGSLRAPDVGKWVTWPFVGEVTPRELLPPVEREEPREGAGGVDCGACTDPDDEYAWTDSVWRIRALPPSGLPLVVILEPRAHAVELDDVDGAELGRMLLRVERAVREIGDVGRVHVCRWQDGSEHLHWWFMARPVRLPQLRGTLAAIWDDVLPPIPDDVWRANVEAYLAGM